MNLPTPTSWRIAPLLVALTLASAVFLLLALVLSGGLVAPASTTSGEARAENAGATSELKKKLPDAGPPEQAAPLSPEATNALDVALVLYDKAKLEEVSDEKNTEYVDAAIVAFLKAHELAPGHPSITRFLADTHNMRKMPLTAIAWAQACLWANPPDEDAEVVRHIAENCQRQAETQKTLIFATARSLAESIRTPPNMVGNRMERAKPVYFWEGNGPTSPFNTAAQNAALDWREGALLDIQYVEAQAGSLDPFVAEVRDSLEGNYEDPSGVLPRTACCCWNVFFDTCLETRDWQGAIEALDWDYGTLAVSERSRQRLRRKAYDWTKPSEDSVARKFYMTVKWDEFFSKCSRRMEFPGQPGAASTKFNVTKQRLVDEWARLALQLGREERKFRVEERLASLTQQAKNKQGGPIGITLEVADLGVPLGKALQRIRAQERASDDDLLEMLNRQGLGHSPAQWEKSKAFLSRNPGVIRTRGYRNLTALHIAAQGSQIRSGLFLVFCSMHDYFSWRQVTSWHDDYFSYGGYYDEKRLGLSSAKQCMEYLLNNGAEVNAKMTTGWTPLHVAAAAFSGEPQAVELVSLLVAKGAEMNARATDGLTPMHIAAMGRNWKVVECLLAKGADVNATDIYERTPLHRVAVQGKADVAKALLRAGADLSAKDYYGNTAAELASINGHTELSDYLKSQ